MLETTVAKRKNKKSASKLSCHKMNHPDHAGDLPRLKRIRGQIDGIERMINDRRYCMDILQQIKASRSALQALEATILKTHLQGCVRTAMSSKRPVSHVV